MKKIFAIILCLALLLGCAALAETPEKESIGTVKVEEAFNIKCKLPEGYTLEPTDLGDEQHIIASVLPADASKPVIRVIIGYNDEYTTFNDETKEKTAMRLNDLPEEAVQTIRDSFITESAMTDVTYEEAETAYGTKLLIVKGKMMDTECVIFYSIYKSYEVEIVAEPGEGANGDLTDEQTRMIVDFLSDMDFEEIKAE